MNDHVAWDRAGFNTLVVVSPMRRDGEEKNQDRAHWFQPGARGAICDGVSTSPFSAEAAEIVAKASPILFQGPVQERLRVVSDLLSTRRIEAMRAPIKVPADTSPAMREMLQEVAKANLAKSFQTTLVAVSLTLTDTSILADVVRCGDSAFFAFSRETGLLAISPFENSPSAPTGREAEHNRTDGIRFGPGDEILAKLICEGIDHSKLFQKAGITNPERWLVCKPIDQSVHNKEGTSSRVNADRFLWLQPNDLLLVPKYLIGNQQDPQYRGYRFIPFSRMIRLASVGQATSPTVTWDSRGAVTAVLPDHFYTGAWIHFQDRFPMDTNYVLASDGFYTCFPDPSSLWAWLCENETALADPEHQSALLQELHDQLNAKCGDDDISFIWVRPLDEVSPHACTTPVKEGPGNVR